MAVSELRTTEEKRLEGAVRSEIMAERTKLSDMLNKRKRLTVLRHVHSATAAALTIITARCY